MKLRIKNMGALGGERVIQFKPGINALVGPNGCGKSTIVSALFLAVAGDSLTRVNLDDLISWGENTAEVELTSNDLQIVRSIIRGKGSKATFKRGSSTLTRREEIDEAVMSMFNIGDKTAFRQVYFAEQFRAIEILEGTNSKRLEALSALLGFGRFEKYRDALKGLINKLFTSHVDDDFLRVLTEQQAVTTERCTQLTKDINKLSESILDKESLDTVKKCADAVAEEVVKEKTGKLESIRAELNDVEAKLSELSVTPPSQQDAFAYAQATRLAALRIELAEAEKNLASIGKSSSPPASQLQALRNQMFERRASLLAERQQQQNRLNLLRDGKCPITQGDPCSDLVKIADPTSVEDAVKSLDNQVASVDEDIKNIDTFIASAQEYERKYATATAEYNKVKGLIEPLYQYSDFDIKGYEDNVRKHQELEAKRKPLDDKATELLKSIAILEAELDNFKDFQVMPQDQIDRAKQILSIHENAESEAREKNSRLQEAITSRDNATSALEKAHEQNEKATKGEKAAEFLEFCRWAMHKDNLPRLLVAKARSELNIRLAKYLELFDFPYVVQWTPDGGIDYVNSYGDMLPASSLSGGQKYLLAVANRCAAADLLGSKFPLMVLDEPTTGLDDENRSKMSIMLQKVAQTLNGRGVSLLVPTHDEELLGMANIIKVKEL